ncbi:MAG: type 1 glutamine amidotransferase [Rhodobacter sp.]|uniref:type 1 glutamine amidotransferase n=1 Tax=Pararhodobacter sp. TaxID=2127056 RepID=UPI001D99DB9A|nr:type 1 glutamine amidotransferase [Pararhodobacter sp.]MCB1345911.1 type 1 glutamine amidotransferase [Paracoccaceae bacterium]MCC0074764.1 type 1 glutamine amidotransferase [Rhodobacter sp.]HPD93346.1 type 1 glutamine amidotransferase [Pararhodobacter sp.]
MKIGILQTGEAHESLRDRHGDYPDMFETLLAGHGFTFARWRVMDMAFPDSVRDCDGWLITGSKFGVYEGHPFIAPLERFIRDAFAAGVPVAGVCFGHQIMAQALGGKVEKFSGGWSTGPTEYDFGGQTLRLNAWHQDQVTALPPGAEPIATSPFCRYAGLAYGVNGLSVQPHPEFDDAFTAGLIEKRGRGVVPDALLAEAAARLGQRPPDSGPVADRIARFFLAANQAAAQPVK